MYLFIDTYTCTQTIVWTSLLLWIMICIKRKATGDVLSLKKKKKKDKLHAMLIYSVTKRDPYNLFSLKITFQVVFIPTS